jgi:hypothetical protein
MQVNEAGLLAHWGKRWAPRLSRLATAGVSRTATEFAETYLAILQGKGSGTGWDQAGETRAAAAFLRDVPAPVVLDMGANMGPVGQRAAPGPAQRPRPLLPLRASARVPAAPGQPIGGYVEGLEHFRGVSNYVASLRTPSRAGGRPARTRNRPG